MSDSDSEAEVLDDGLNDTTSKQKTPNTFGRGLMQKLRIATGAEATGLTNVNKSMILEMSQCKMIRHSPIMVT